MSKIRRIAADPKEQKNAQKLNMQHQNPMLQSAQGEAAEKKKNNQHVKYDQKEASLAYVTTI